MLRASHAARQEPLAIAGAPCNLAGAPCRETPHCHRGRQSKARGRNGPIPVSPVAPSSLTGPARQRVSVRLRLSSPRQYTAGYPPTVAVLAESGHAEAWQLLRQARLRMPLRNWPCARADTEKVVRGGWKRAMAAGSAANGSWLAGLAPGRRAHSGNLPTVSLKPGIQSTHTHG